MQKIIALLGIYLGVSLSCSAEVERKHVSLTLTNDSSEILTYLGPSNTNPETLFLVAPKIIMPGKHISVTAISTDYNLPDLSADLRFQDELGRIHLYHVADPAQLHYARHTLILSDQQNIYQLTNLDHPQLHLQYS
jgi:hypothetical protein